MEALLAEHEKLARKSNLSKSIDDVQKTIDLLTDARNAVAASKYSRNVRLALPPPYLLKQETLSD